MKSLTFKIVGEAPLLLHNGALCDPLNEFTRKIKEISAKRAKVDADHEQIAKLEWFGSLYLLDSKPCIPSEMMEAALIGKGGAARKVKMGKQAAAGLFVPNHAPIEYDGPTDLEELYADKRFIHRSKVKVQTASVMRTRPIFREWAATIAVCYSPDLINEKDVIQWMQVAGEQIGIGDWRPKFGRFSATLLA